MNKKASKSDAPLGFTVSGVLARAGGRAEVARLCGVTVQSVMKWRDRIPDRHASTVAIAAGLPLEIVRPDLVRTGHEVARQAVQSLGEKQ